MALTLALGQIDRPRIRFIRLQALAISRMCHDWIDSGCASFGQPGEGRGC